MAKNIFKKKKSETLSNSVNFQTGHLATVLLVLILFAWVSPAISGERLLAPRLLDSLSETWREAAGAAPKIDSLWSLNDYLLLSLERSPALRSAFYNWLAAVERAGYAGALPDPTFSYSRFIENVETRVGPQNQRFNIKQSFPWFGTLGARKDIATAAANASYQKFESERLRLFYRVKRAYYELYYVGQDILLTGDNLQLLTFWESVARSKYKAALVQHPDIIKAQVELGLLEDRLLSLQDKLLPAKARLRAALDLPDSIELPLPSTIAITESDLQEKIVLAAAVENNPDLQSLEQIVASRYASVRLARKANLPNFTVGFDYIETGKAINAATPGSGADPWMVGVGISLPVWLGTNRSKRREAAAKLHQAEYNLLDARNRMIAYTRHLLFEYSNALRKIRLYRDGLIPKGEQSLNVNYASYQAGKLDFLNVLDAQRQLLNFQLQFERSTVDLENSRAELEMITGQKLTY